jgi:hypothetical protein
VKTPTPRVYPGAGVVFITNHFHAQGGTMSNRIFRQPDAPGNKFPVARHHMTARSVADQIAGIRRPRPLSPLTRGLMAAQYRNDDVAEVAKLILLRAQGLRNARRIHWVNLASDALLLPRPERDRFFAALQVLLAELGWAR